MTDIIQSKFAAVYPWLNNSTRQILFSAMRQTKTRVFSWRNGKGEMATLSYSIVYGERRTTTRKGRSKEALKAPGHHSSHIKNSLDKVPLPF
jgi:hypothetical protein